MIYDISLLDKYIELNRKVNAEMDKVTECLHTIYKYHENMLCIDEIDAFLLSKNLDKSVKNTMQRLERNDYRFNLITEERRKIIALLICRYGYIGYLASDRFWAVVKEADEEELLKEISNLEFIEGEIKTFLNSYLRRRYGEEELNKRIRREA